MKFTKWFKTFIEEKGLGEKEETFVIKWNGSTHLVESNVVMDLIKNCTTHEQSKIRETLVMIDFRNGDVWDYIKFLAECYVKEWF